MASALVERHGDRIAGVLSCYDRVVVTGTLPTVCYAGGMTRFLYANQIRIFDYPDFAVTLRDQVRDQAALLASEAGIAIEHVSKSHVRKEAIVAKVLDQRGDHPGLVHVISAMEACDAYKPWHDKQTHRTYLRPDSGKCLHYYFYFMDAELGLVYLRVPTWSPFRLQFYCNGHSWLARQLAAAGIGFTAADNAFVRIDDWQRGDLTAEKSGDLFGFHALPGAPVCSRRLLSRCSCARPADQAAPGGRQDRQGHQLLRPGRQRAAARFAEPAGEHRRNPPRRPAGAARHALASPTLTPTSPTARHRCDQAGDRNLPLLPDSHRTPRRRGALPRDAERPHSGSDLMGFLMQKVPRVGS